MRNLAPHLSRVVLALVLGISALAGCERSTPSGPTAAAAVPAPAAARGGGGGTGGDKICGGIAGLPCDAKQFCEFPVGVCSSIADGTGVCKPQADACPAVYAPVCGCDNRTYGNDCERQAAGVSALHAGECDRRAGEGERCAGAGRRTVRARAVLRIRARRVQLDPGRERASAGGHRRRAPTSISRSAAATARPTATTAIVRPRASRCCHDGACGDRRRRRRRVRRHRRASTCPRGLFCEFDAGVCSSIADGTGTCKRLPQACTLNYAPGVRLRQQDLRQRLRAAGCGRVQAARRRVQKRRRRRGVRRSRGLPVQQGPVLRGGARCLRHHRRRDRHLPPAAADLHARIRARVRLRHADLQQRLRPRRRRRIEGPRRSLLTSSEVAPTFHTRRVPSSGGVLMI